MERKKRSEAGVGTRGPNGDPEPEPQDIIAREAEGSIRRIPRGEPGTRVNVYPDEMAEQRAGEHAFAAAAGDEGQVVEVTWGEELFQPVQYNSFRVGPFKVATTVRRGETIGDAMLRVHRQIAATATALHDEKAKVYLRSLADLAGEVKRTSVR